MVGSLLLSDPARYAEHMRSELHAVVDRLVDSKQIGRNGVCIALPIHAKTIIYGARRAQ